MRAPDNDLLELPEWPYLATAAVLTSFAAEKLRPLSGQDDLRNVASMLAKYAEPIRFGPASGQWRLSDGIRQQVLRSLGRGSIQRALKANPERPSDPTQRAIEKLAQSPPKLGLKGLALQELLGLERAVEWFEGVPDASLPNRTNILAQIEREKLLEPMRRLAGAEFVGRQKEFARLRRYVDHLPSAGIWEGVARVSDRLLHIFVDRPPLMIYGPGGVGKSTLVAHFILRHAGPDQAKPIPFIYLDFDRWSSYFRRDPETGTIGALRTDELLTEALHQIRKQFPEVAADAAGLETFAAESTDSADASEIAVSAHFDRSHDLRVRLADLLNTLARLHGRNILFVIDTFEIVQRRGSSVVFSLLEMVAFLLQQVSRLRVVIAGRSNLRSEDFDFSERDALKWEELPLAGFDEAAGKAYLRARLAKLNVSRVPDTIQGRIVTLTRGNPLSLRLAANVFAHAGIEDIETTIGRQQLDSALANEQIQGMLHARIVEHLEDERLKQIADPGLVVRRISPKVISHVLAGHGGLEIESEDDAFKLYQQLQSEVSLFEPTDDGALRHRPEVRVLMLPLIRRKLGDRARIIDQAAVNYWQGETSPAARAEEIYHRIWLGQPESELNARWIPSASNYLQDALDEFNELDLHPEGQAWLADKLGRELSRDLRTKAEQAVWERDAARKARQLAVDGHAAEALKVLRERSKRSPTSPIWILEIDVLRLLGSVEEALHLSEQALKAAKGVDAPAHILELLIRRVAVLERLELYEKALETATEACVLGERERDPVALFSVRLLCARLLRKMSSRERHETLVEKLVPMLGDPNVRHALTTQPSLLRHAAAELGEQDPELLLSALERLGLEGSSLDPSTLPTLSAIVKSAAPQLFKSASSHRPSASERFGSQVATLLRNPLPDRLEVWRELSRYYANTADLLLKQTIS
jgi:cellulose synthase operon protein C